MQSYDAADYGYEFQRTDMAFTSTWRQDATFEGKGDEAPYAETRFRHPSLSAISHCAFHPTYPCAAVVSETSPNA
ncbi:hypothetical protein KIPB_007346, partial [Kipferlia bialata]|eukprot:g7346.t1